MHRLLAATVLSAFTLVQAPALAQDKPAEKKEEKKAEAKKDEAKKADAKAAAATKDEKKAKKGGC